MDAETYRQMYAPLIVIAFYVIAIAWIGYTILAPWWRSAIGWIVWALFLALGLVLFVPYMRIMHDGVPFRYEISVGTMIFFIVVMILVTYGIYTTQIKGYLTYRRAKRKADKTQKRESKSQ